MTSVHSLGYVGVHATDVAAWRTFAAGILGMQHVEGVPGATSALFRMDERACRLIVEPAASDRLAYLGFEVANGTDLEALRRRVLAAGFPAEPDDALAKERSVAGLWTTTDPAGLRLEFFYGQRIEREPFVSPLGVRFVTGDAGVGHAALMMDAPGEVEFYTEVLGFRTSDIAPLPALTATILHCNPRHHTLALGVGAGLPTGLRHLMVEVTSLDDVGRAFDRAEAAGLATTTIGRHSNDEMISLYLTSPSGFEIEYGCFGRTVRDETWTVTQVLNPDRWGHQRLAPPPQVAMQSTSGAAQ